jgi:hypothetical protein
LYDRLLIVENTIKNTSNLSDKLLAKSLQRDIRVIKSSKRKNRFDIILIPQDIDISTRKINKRVYNNSLNSKEYYSRILNKYVKMFNR